MDEYREAARNAKAAPIGAILSDFAKEDGPETYRDEQRLSIAGIVASSKTKTTKNNTLMAYVTLEDDTGAMELLVFARVLGRAEAISRRMPRYWPPGGCRSETRRRPRCWSTVSARWERPGRPLRSGKAGRNSMSKVPTAQSPQFEKIKKIFLMFPGEQQAVFYFSDTRKRMGTPCVIHPP